MEHRSSLFPTAGTWLHEAWWESRPSTVLNLVTAPALLNVLRTASPRFVGCAAAPRNWELTQTGSRRGVAAAAGNIRGLEDKSEATDVSSKPNALVLFNPVYDNGPDGYGHSRVQTRWREISPLHNIRRGAPPTIVFLGTQDRLVPVSTAQRYKRLMERAESRCDLHLYENQTHGFFNRDRKGGKYEVTLMEMDKFLVSLGWLANSTTHRQESR